MLQLVDKKPACIAALRDRRNDACAVDAECLLHSAILLKTLNLSLVLV